MFAQKGMSAAHTVEVLICVYRLQQRLLSITYT